MSSVRERIKALRKEATVLEETAVDEDQAEQYRTALHEERALVALNLARANSHAADEREALPNPFAPNGADVHAVKTWGERAADHQRRLDAIDAELDRVKAPLA
jgi:hypothetical protein